MTTISVVATVLDEVRDIDDWLTALTTQARVPDEIIIVDGGSSDGTWQRLLDWADSPSRVFLQCPGANISVGRNEAIARATGDIIAVTDAGTRADREWVSTLLAAFDDRAVDVASGFFIPLGDTVWERSLAATTLPHVKDVNAEAFLPSSRSVAFRRAWWELGVRYPEWLDYCEDLVWDLSMKRAGARFRFVPEATVGFRVRKNPISFWHQYFRYARGDGKAGLFARRHAIRYAVWCGALLVLILRDRRLLGTAAVLAGAYCVKPVQRLWPRDRELNLSMMETCAAMALVPLQRAIGDIAKMLGYPVGLVWRVKTRGSLRSSTTWREISPLESSTARSCSARRNQVPPSSRACAPRGEPR